MEKTKLGISVQAFAALIYLLGANSAFSTIGILLMGYGLFVEGDAVKVEVKKAFKVYAIVWVVYAFKAALSELLGFVNTLTSSSVYLPSQISTLISFAVAITFIVFAIIAYTNKPAATTAQ